MEEDGILIEYMNMKTVTVAGLTICLCSLSLSRPPSSLSPSLSLLTHREGDMYAALRDAESALALCPSYQKALRRRLRCLQHLNRNKAANHLLQRYMEQYPNDSDFISRTKADLEIALKSESGSTCIR